MQELVVLFIAHCYDKQPSNTSHKIRNYNDGTGGKILCRFAFVAALMSKAWFLRKRLLYWCFAQQKIEAAAK